MFIVFVRNWWKEENGELVPCPEARKTTIAKVKTVEEAKEIAKAWNSTHKPGKLSRKAEFYEI